MDTSFLAAYSLGLYVSGSLGDHVNPKLLLVVSYGCVTVVTSTIAVCTEVGWLNPIFLSCLFAINGLMQSVGWPCVSSVFVNWFGKKDRGVIYGFWQSSGNFGNVLGALLTSFLTATVLLTWQWAYLVMGQFCLVVAVVNAVFLIVHPEERGIVIEELDEKMSKKEAMLSRHLSITDVSSKLDQSNSTSFKEARGISFINAWKIPGVFQYSTSFFCLKFSSYGLMLWLPLYI